METTHLNSPDPLISLVVPYYNNPNMLQIQIAEWLRYDANDIEVVLLDDGSQEYPAREAVELNVDKITQSVRFQFLRALEDIQWNLCGIRNLGFLRAKGRWIFSTDIDHVAPKELLQRMRPMLISCEESGVINNYFTFNRKLPNGEDVPKVHLESFIIQRSTFWMLGGYDEDYNGIHGCDRHFITDKLQKQMERVHVPIPKMISYNNRFCPDASSLPGREHRKRKSEFIVRRMMKLEGKFKHLPQWIRFKWEKVI
jgi:glycosyltransferase involved in cell wall biosynthesis